MPRFGKPIVVVVDGEIGAGKTTLISHLVAELQTPKFGELKVIKIGEPVDLWKSIGVLQAFYADVPRMSYEFQSFTFVTRIQETISAYEANPDADVYILERSIFSDRHLFVDMLHQDGHIDPMRMTMYDTWWKMWSRLMPFVPSGFVYLKPDIDECMSRIKARARDGEDSIPASYQMRLREKHEAFLRPEGVLVADNVRAPVLTINDNGNFRDSLDERSRFVQRIYEFIASLGVETDASSESLGSAGSSGDVSDASESAPAASPLLPESPDKRDKLAKQDKRPVGAANEFAPGTR